MAKWPCLSTLFAPALQGAATDLRLVRDQLHLMQPGMDFLLCKSNEGRTGDGFEAMGARLALEVAEYLQVGVPQHLQALQQL